MAPPWGDRKTSLRAEKRFLGAPPMPPAGRASVALVDVDALGTSGRPYTPGWAEVEWPPMLKRDASFLPGGADGGGEGGGMRSTRGVWGAWAMMLSLLWLKDSWSEPDARGLGAERGCGLA